MSNVENGLLNINYNLNKVLIQIKAHFRKVRVMIEGPALMNLGLGDRKYLDLFIDNDQWPISARVMN